VGHYRQHPYGPTVSWNRVVPATWTTRSRGAGSRRGHRTKCGRIATLPGPWGGRPPRTPSSTMYAGHQPSGRRLFWKRRRVNPLIVPDRLINGVDASSHYGRCQPSTLLVSRPPGRHHPAGGPTHRPQSGGSPQKMRQPPPRPAPPGGLLAPLAVREPANATRLGIAIKQPPPVPLSSLGYPGQPQPCQPGLRPAGGQRRTGRPSPPAAPCPGLSDGGQQGTGQHHRRPATPRRRRGARPARLHPPAAPNRTPAGWGIEGVFGPAARDGATMSAGRRAEGKWRETRPSNPT
jgi:hypothetical protein